MNFETILAALTIVLPIGAAHATEPMSPEICRGVKDAATIRYQSHFNDAWNFMSRDAQAIYTAIDGLTPSDLQLVAGYREGYGSPETLKSALNQRRTELLKSFETPWHAYRDALDHMDIDGPFSNVARYRKLSAIANDFLSLIGLIGGAIDFITVEKDHMPYLRVDWDSGLNTPWLEHRFGATPLSSDRRANRQAAEAMISAELHRNVTARLDGDEAAPYLSLSDYLRRHENLPEDCLNPAAPSAGQIADDAATLKRDGAEAPPVSAAVHAASRSIQ